MSLGRAANFQYPLLYHRGRTCRLANAQDSSVPRKRLPMRRNAITGVFVSLLAMVPFAQAQRETRVQIQTARLEVRYEPATGHFSARLRDQARPFLKEGKLSGKTG